MKIRTSYFYQIRNFNRTMIPISTALWDPTWFHANQGENHIFYDARKILNGVRINPIIQAGKKCGEQEPVPCPCQEKSFTTCSFLSNYRKNLNEIDFDETAFVSIAKFGDFILDTPSREAGTSDVQTIVMDILSKYCNSKENEILYSK